ncbi:flagellar biosynthetic protein FliO [Zhongshania sp.]|uniref:flagellar biosynthetic protein FliO n=1 Tax=Zhongshania sp. TaxID=1971902 RepID=UPI00356375A7
MKGYLLNRFYALGSIASAMAMPAWSADVAEPLITAKTNASAPALPTATPSVAQLDISGLLGSLLLVVLCIVAVMWLLRKSRLVAGPNQAGVAVVGQIPLSMKEKLLVVQIGDEKLLIGCTSAAINTLHTWTSPPSSDTLAPQNSPFAKLLARLPTQNQPKPPSGGSGGQS